MTPEVAQSHDSWVVEAHRDHSKQLRLLNKSSETPFGQEALLGARFMVPVSSMATFDRPEVCRTEPIV